MGSGWAHVVNEAGLGVQRSGEHEGVVRVSVARPRVGRALGRMLLQHAEASIMPLTGLACEVGTPVHSSARPERRHAAAMAHSA